MQSSIAPINATITYHVACVGGGYMNKLEVLLQHIECTRHCGNITYHKNENISCNYCDGNILK